MAKDPVVVEEVVKEVAQVVNETIVEDSVGQPPIAINKPLKVVTVNGTTFEDY